MQNYQKPIIDNDEGREEDLLIVSPSELLLTTQQKVQEALFPFPKDFETWNFSDQKDWIRKMGSRSEETKKFLEVVLMQNIHLINQKNHKELFFFLNELEYEILEPKNFIGIWNSSNEWSNLYDIMREFPVYKSYFQEKISFFVSISPKFEDLSDLEKNYCLQSLRILRATKEVFDQMMDPQKKQEKLAEIEDREAIKTLFFEYMLDELEKINEGEQGIIYRLDAQNMYQSILKNEQMEGPLFQEENKKYIDELMNEHFGDDWKTENRAVKMLKIFNKERGDTEVLQHQKAVDLLKNKGTEYAQVPKIYTALSLKKEFLENSKKANIFKVRGKSIFDASTYYIIMDYIKGKDFFTHILSQILEREGYSREEIEKDSFDEIIEKIQKIIPWKIPQYNLIHNTQEEECEVEESAKRNFYEIQKYCRKHDIHIPFEVREKIEKTLDHFHNHNFYHRDLHSRNIMFDYDENGAIKTPYIIDFATAKELQKDEKPYEDDYQKYRNDNNILSLLEI